MSMHLVKHLTTTRTTKRDQKITKAQQEEFERGWRDRNQRLKQMGLPKETFEQYMDWVYGRGKKEKSNTKTNSHVKSSTTTKETKIQNYSLSGNLEAQKDGNKMDTSSKYLVPNGGCTKKPSPTYTGKNMLGIATMHKSNSVPVFSTEDAEAISKMRR